MEFTNYRRLQLLLWRGGGRRGVSKGVEDGCRPPALWAGPPRNGRKAGSRVARPQGVEGSSMVGPIHTLGSPWPPLAIRPCFGEAWRSPVQDPS
jgi:hypothetical protein